MIEVSRVALELDLSRLSQWLWAQGIAHRIAEEQGEQVLYIAPEQAEYLPAMRQLLRRYVMEPEFRQVLASTPLPVSTEPELEALKTPYPRVSPRQAPLLFGVLGMAAIAALLTGFGAGGPALRALLIVDPFQLDFHMMDLSARWEGLLAILAAGQWWRLITPDLLHFHLLHLAFNALMCWVWGGQLELRRGSSAFLGLFVFASVISNVAQFLGSHYLFGGLSGFAYALIGYSWLWRRVEPDVFMPDFFWRFSLLWLVLGYTPLTVWLGIGQMANEAHLFGLLAGLFWAWLTVLRPARRR